MELIHLATLIHDDVLDGADKRRDQPTANARWGNSLSVLLGDCLLAHALDLSTYFDDAEISRRIARAASAVCTGEILQTQRRFDLNLSLPDYYRIIEMKTAALFAVAAELGARLNHVAPEVSEALRLYGLKIGTAYQVYDDLLDIAGDESKAGKTLGTDLKKGKLTLPMLKLLQASENGQRERLTEIILRGSDEDLAGLRDSALRSGSMAAAAQEGVAIIDEGLRQLDVLGDSPYPRRAGRRGPPARRDGRAVHRLGKRPNPPKKLCHPERSEVRAQSKDLPTSIGMASWKVLRLSLADLAPAQDDRSFFRER